MKLMLPVEIQGCVMVHDRTGQSAVVPAASTETPQFWGLYVRDSEGLAHHIEGFPTEEAALEFIKSQSEQEMKNELSNAYKAGFMEACKWGKPVTQDTDSPAFGKKLEEFIRRQNQ